MATTGQNLGKVLAERGVSKAKLSRDAEVSYKTVIRIVKGDRVGSLDSWMRFAEALDCETSELIGDKRGER